MRRPQWPTELIKAITRLRRLYPRWGKAKLVLLARREGFHTSESTVGRVLAIFTDVVCSTTRPTPSLPSPRLTARPWAQRVPGGPPAPKTPGNLVQVDTLHLRIPDGVRLWQFTARDVVSRWDVVEAHRRATSQAAALFLSTLRARCPFQIKAIQIYGGSEFRTLFERACQQLDIRLYLLPPRSPKLNAHVGRANGTHRHEFYEVVPVPPPSTPSTNESDSGFAPTTTSALTSPSEA